MARAGVHDIMVRREDSDDVLAFPNARTQDIAGADHDTILEIKSDARYRLLRSGFTDAIDKPATSPPPQRVVFVLHGIRASNLGNWVQSVEAEIKKQDPSAIVIGPGYNYFSAAGFALPSGRRANIPWFRKHTRKFWPSTETRIRLHRA